MTVRTATALLLVSLATIAGPAGCGGEDGAEVPPADTPPPGALVVFAKGGGLAGIALRLEVGQDGTARLTERMGADTTDRTFDVPEDDLATLTDALDAARDADDDSPGVSAGCADCFLYDVTADDLAFELDDVTYSDDGTPVELVTLVAILDELAGSA